MFAWQATVQDDAGNAITLPVVSVYEADGITLASIYSEAGSPLPNPMTGTLEGFVQFWADAGSYVVEAAKSGEASERWVVDLGAGTESPQSWGDFSQFMLYQDGRTVSFNGVQFFRDRSANIPGLGAGAGWKPLGVASPLHFRAVGDGAVDDAVALASALASGLQLEGGGRTYKSNSPLVGGSGFINATIDFSGVTGLGATQYCFTVSGGEFGLPVNLTANAIPGATVISLASSSGIVAGDLIRMESNLWWASNTSVPLSETVRVLGVSGNNVTLESPLEWSYATAQTGRVRKISTSRTGNWGGLRFIGGGNTNGMTFAFIEGLRAGDFSFLGFTGRNFGLTAIFDFSIGNVDANASEGGVSGLNYGVLVSGGSENGTINNISGTGLRHCFTGGGTSGINKAIHVGNIVGVESLAGEYDNHPACRDMSVGMVTSVRPMYEAGEDGLVLQGVNATIGGFNCDMMGKGRNGVIIQPFVDAQGDWFFNVNADIRNATQFGLAYSGVGSANISYIKVRMGCQKPLQESVYLTGLTSNIDVLDLDVISIGSSNASRPSIRVWQSDDTFKFKQCRISLNSTRDTSNRNVQLQGTVANPIRDVSLSGVISGGTHGVFGINAVTGTVNVASVLFTGQSVGPTSGI